MNNTVDYSKLINDSINGSNTAFEELYQLTHKTAYHTASLLLKNPDDVEDVLQNSYIKAYKKLSELKNPESFEGWIKSIVENECRNYIKKEKRISAPIIFFKNKSEEHSEEWKQPIPQEYMEREELRKSVAEILDKLSPEVRACIVLFHYEEKNLNEISEILDIPLGTVKSRLHNGRKQIEKEFNKLRKKDPTLYSIGAIPVIFALLSYQAKNTVVPAAISEGVIASVASSTSAASTASATGTAAAVATTAGASVTSSAATTATATIAVKITAVAVAGSVAVGGTVAVKNHIKNKAVDNTTAYYSTTALPETCTTSEASTEVSSQLETTTMITTATTAKKSTTSATSTTANTSASRSSTSASSSTSTKETVTKTTSEPASTTAATSKTTTTTKATTTTPSTTKETTTETITTTTTKKATATTQTTTEETTTQKSTTTASPPTTAPENNYGASGGVITEYTGSDSDISIPSTIDSETVTAIGAGAFAGNTDINSISLPSSVTQIGQEAFADCTSLSSVSLPSSLELIGIGAFYGCSSLTSVTIPDGTKTISDEAFAQCTSLTTITIPSSVTSISDDAFDGCDSLTIRCEEGSAAHDFAVANNINFSLI